jgi:PST family polysaccharide transporter
MSPPEPDWRERGSEPSGTPGPLTSTVVRGAGIASGGYVVAQVISFASYLALARLLTPSQFGMFAAAIVVVGIGAIIGESGMLAALIQRRDRLEAALESAFVATLAAGVLLSALSLAAAPVIGVFFNSGKVTVVAAAMSASMLFRLAVIVPNALLQRRFSFIRRVAIDPLGMLAFAAAAVTSAALGLGVWSLVIGTYSQLAFDLLAAWLFAGWRPHPSRASMRVWRELARFGRPVVIAEMIRNGITALPVIALGRFAGAGTIGQYSYASRVSKQPSDAGLALGAYVLLPALSRVAHDAQRFRAALTRALRWMCAVSFPLGMLLVPLGTSAVVLVFGARWHAAGEAVMPLGVYAALLALDSIASEVWKAAGRPDMLPRMHALSFVLIAALIAALVVPFGLIGVATGIALSGVGVGAYAVYGIHRVAQVPLSRLLAEIWPPAVAAAVMAGVLFFTEHGLLHSDHHALPVGAIMLIIQGLVGIMLYLCCLSALSPGCRGELVAVIRHTLGGRLRRGSNMEGPAHAPGPRPAHVPAGRSAHVRTGTS